MKLKNKCCLCGKEIIGYGNNPAPLKSSVRKCCDECNLKLVVPARMKMKGEYTEK